MFATLMATLFYVDIFHAAAMAPLRHTITYADTTCLMSAYAYATRMLLLLTRHRPPSFSC